MFFLILIFSKARKKRAVSHKSSTATLSVKAHCGGLCVSLFLFYNELPGLLMLTKRKKKFLLFTFWKLKKNLNSTGPTRVRPSPLHHPTWVWLRWECICPLGLLKIPQLSTWPHRRPTYESFEDMVRTSLSHRTSQMPVWSVSSDLQDKQPTTYFHVCSFEISS